MTSLRLTAVLIAVLSFSAFVPPPAAVWAQTGDEPAIIANSGHSNTVKAIAFSPDGLWFATASSDSTIKLWELASGRLLRTLVGHRKEAKSVAISPDGKLIASVSDDGTAKIWDAATGQVLQTIPVVGNQSDYVQGQIAFANDGHSVWTVSFSSIRRWDVASGALRQTISATAPALFQSFALSPDGKWIAVAHSGAVGASLAKSGIGSQVKLLDAVTGQVIRVLGTYSTDNMVTGITFSADGHFVLVGGNDGVAKVWESATGRLLYTLDQSAKASVKSVNGIAFSPDSHLIATGGGPGGVTLWDVASGRPIRSLDAVKWVWSIAFSPDGHQIACGSANIAVIDTATGLPRPGSFGLNVSSSITPTPASRVSFPITLTPASQDRWLVLGPHGMTVWDAADWHLVQSYDPMPGFAQGSAQFAARDATGHLLIATNTGEYTIKLWDTTSGTLLRTFAWGDIPKKPACPTCAAYSLENVTISPNARWLAATLWGDHTRIKVWDAASGQLLHDLPAQSDYYRAADKLAFSPDSLTLGALSYAKAKHWMRFWDAESGKPLRAFTLAEPKGVGSSGFSILSYAPDSRSLMIEFDAWDAKLGTNTVYTAAAIDPGTGKLLKIYHPTATSNYPSVTAFSPDASLFVLGMVGSETVNIWDTATGRYLRSLAGNPGQPQSIAFSPDGRRLAVGNSNGTSSVFDVATGERLVVTLHAESGEWVTITPEGFFTASEHGAKLLHIVQGFNTTGIDQVYQALYRPDLVREKLAGDPDGKVKEAAAKLDLTKALASGLAPRVTILTPKGESQTGGPVTAEAEIEDGGGGIGKVEWRLNGVTVGVEDGSAAAGGAPLKLKRDLALAPGSNSIELVAYNKANLVASVPSVVTVKTQAWEGQPKPKLVVLAVGINDYADPRLKLDFAVADAQSLADALSKAGEGVYDGVDVTVLRDKEVTREGLNAAFTAISAKVQPGDVFVFYVAGHGKTIDGRYYFGQQDIHVTDIASIAAQGIAQDEWQKWFAAIPARKSVLLFDTCESGSLTEDAGGGKALEQQAASGRLAQATGRTIMTASTSEQLALEGVGGHGLFTYDVLDALGRADSDGDGMLEVTELAAFVYAQVSMFTENKQVPQVRMSGPDYALVKQTGILGESQPKLAIPAAATHVVSNATEFQIEPQMGARGIHKLAAQTPVTVIHSEQGWVLVAKEGKLLGYVAQGDLTPIH